jgi:hypothetical protein
MDAVLVERICGGRRIADVSAYGGLSQRIRSPHGAGAPELKSVSSVDERRSQAGRGSRNSANQRSSVSHGGNRVGLSEELSMELNRRDELRIAARVTQQVIQGSDLSSAQEPVLHAMAETHQLLGHFSHSPLGAPDAHGMSPGEHE